MCFHFDGKLPPQPLHIQHAWIIRWTQNEFPICSFHSPRCCRVGGSCACATNVTCLPIKSECQTTVLCEAIEYGWSGPLNKVNMLLQSNTYLLVLLHVVCLKAFHTCACSLRAYTTTSIILFALIGGGCFHRERETNVSLTSWLFVFSIFSPPLQKCLDDNFSTTI